MMMSVVEVAERRGGGSAAAVSRRIVVPYRGSGSIALRVVLELSISKCNQTAKSDK